jgi:uncharacterized protein (TIGR04222 family)
MTSQDGLLYEGIRTYPLDAPRAAVSFVQRLAGENGWTEDYSRRVVDEYRRFAFLGLAAGHPVSPSDQVDQAWHLHLSYTRSYWNEFCPKVLGKPFHHEPSLGGEEERRKLATWYKATLRSYRSFFGENPPADIWPDPRQGPGESRRWRRVNLDRSLVLPRKPIRIALLILGIAFAAAMLAQVPLDLGAQFRSILNQRGPDFLGLYAMTLALAVGVGLAFRRAMRGPVDAPLPSEMELHPYEAAYLAGKEKHAISTVLFSLVDRKILAILPGSRRLRKAGTLSSDAHPLERAIVAGVTQATEPDDLRAAATSALRGIHSRLVALGFLIPKRQEALARVIPAIALLATMFLGIGKISIGVERHRPVALLILLVIGTAVAALAFLARSLRITRRGQRALEALRHDHGALKLKAVREEAGLSTLELPLVVALFGVSAVAGADFVPLRAALNPPPSVVSSGGGDGGGCGGGCGGGGCGGGCGGCSG